MGVILQKNFDIIGVFTHDGFDQLVTFVGAHTPRLEVSLEMITKQEVKMLIYVVLEIDRVLLHEISYNLITT